jgi:hypothetical protein
MPVSALMKMTQSISKSHEPPSPLDNAPSAGLKDSRSFGQVDLPIRVPQFRQSRGGDKERYGALYTQDLGGGVYFFDLAQDPGPEPDPAVGVVVLVQSYKLGGSII